MFQVKHAVHNNSINSWRRYENYVNASVNNNGISNGISIGSEISKYAPIFRSMRIPAFMNDDDVFEEEEEEEDSELDDEE